jgi:outer membrane protein OmpA-like peptidoglycan-associated protein
MTFKRIRLGSIVVLAVAGCASGLDRSEEVARNRAAGITVSAVADGVEVQLPDTVLFGFGEAWLRADADLAIERVAVVLNRSQRPIRIEGHTDNIGSHAHNQALSLARAEVVMLALAASNVGTHRMRTLGFAYDKPVASNDTEAGRASNRRTQIVLEGETLDSVMGRMH